MTPRRSAASLVYHADDRSGRRVARYTEPIALLVAQLAYGGKGGPELAYRFEWLGT